MLEDKSRTSVFADVTPQFTYLEFQEELVWDPLCAVCMCTYLCYERVLFA